jgi:hypothetical protein
MQQSRGAHRSFPMKRTRPVRRRTAAGTSKPGKIKPGKIKPGKCKTAAVVLVVGSVGAGLFGMPSAAHAQGAGAPKPGATSPTPAPGKPDGPAIKPVAGQPGTQKNVVSNSPSATKLTGQGSGAAPKGEKARK